MMTVTDYIKHISKLSNRASVHMQAEEYSAALKRLFEIEASVKAAIEPLYWHVHDRSKLCKTCGAPLELVPRERKQKGE